MYHVQFIEWAKCGDNTVSIIPTVCWAVGASALAHRILTALFRRFLFRRTPLWEVMLQHLLFMWMVIYSMHFWVILVKILKVIVDFFYQNNDVLPPGVEIENRKVIQQWVIWMFGVTPLAVYIHTRPRPEMPPLMIWITTSPWQRREMGPYGYYLNRPLSTLPSAENISLRQQAIILRRTHSDSKVIIKEPPKKRRYSKSV